MSDSASQLDYVSLHSEYQALQQLDLSLDMTRGKPSSQQLDLTNPMLSLPSIDFKDKSGTDCRNYGGLDGLPEMKSLFGEILDVEPSQVIIGGNSSLTMMYDTIARACQFGVVEGEGPWNALPTRKFICPTPGYDRHFGITEHFGFELIPVDVDKNGPNMDQVEALVANDASVLGIWCVPKYSNPTGCVYSPDTVARLAKMKTAAAGFRIIWDNAYAEHHLIDNPQSLDNIMQRCIEANTENRVILFGSTSKISHAGSGVGAMAASPANITDFKRHIGVQSIGSDKINQLRHLQFFQDISGLRQHMKKHAQLVKPKFDLVLEILERELGALNIANWTKPEGGYFISLDIPEGKATQVIELALQAGVKLTSAGAPFPYGVDKKDKNIRIAPTFPSMADIQQATEVLTTCIKLAVSEK